MATLRQPRRTNLRKNSLDLNKIFTDPTLDAEGKVVLPTGFATDISSLSDVTATTFQDGQFLKFNGGTWANTSISSLDLSDSTEIAKLQSPGFSGVPTAPTAATLTNNDTIATTAFVHAYSATAATNALTYEGSVSVANFATTLQNATKGSFYKISTGGTASDGREYASGDSIIVNADMGGSFSNSKLDKIDNTDVSTTDQIIASHSPQNYTANENASLTTHISAIDTALGNSFIPSIAQESAGQFLIYDGQVWVNQSIASTNLSDSAELARLDSPDFTGTPTAPTPLAGDNSTRVATTAYVDSATPNIDPTLTSIAAVDTLQDQMLYTTAPDVYAATAVTASARQFLAAEDVIAQRNQLQLGSAALLQAGADALNVLQLDDQGHLPAVDGSALLNLPQQSQPSATTEVEGVIETATNLEAVNNQISNKALVPSNIPAISLSLFNNDLDVQSADPALTSIANLPTSGNEILVTTGSDQYSTSAISQAGKDILSAADVPAQRTHLGLGSAALSGTTDFLPSTANLESLSNVTLGTLTDSQVLTYQAGSWVNADATGGSASSTSPNIIYKTTDSYTLDPQTVSNLIILHGAENSNDFTVTFPQDIADALATSTDLDTIGESLTFWVGRRNAGNINFAFYYDPQTQNPAFYRNLDVLNGASGYIQQTTVSSGQFVKVVAYKFSATNIKFFIESPSSSSFSGSYNDLTDTPTLGTASELDHGTNANQLLRFTVNNQLPALDGSLLTNLPLAAYAPLASPSFTGVPIAPTAVQGTNTTQVATTAYVDTAVANAGGGSSITHVYERKTADFDAAGFYHYSVSTASNNVLASLPSLANVDSGTEIRFKLIDATNTLTIGAPALETIDGQGQLDISTQYTSVTLVAGDDEWEII